MQPFSFLENTSDSLLFEPGQVIFREGQVGDQMYLILEGILQVSVQGHSLDLLSAGNIVGEMALIDEGVRSATGTAVSLCKLLPINRSRFAELVQQHPDFALHVMSIMSNRLRRLMEVEAKRQRLEEEMKIGRDIQLSLLPKEVPVVPGWEFAAYYQAARQIGGDLYDFIQSPHDPHRLNVVIADVTGKGVPAALFMASVRSVIRAISLNDRPPAETLHRTNRFIVRDVGAQLFTSAFYASLNTHNGQLSFANAGHEWPLWWQQQTQTVTQLKIPGMLLGAFNEIHPIQQEVTIAPGDVVVFFTDGVTEAHNAEKALFDDDRLHDTLTALSHLSAEEIMEGIVTAVSTFTGSTPQSDDLTLVVVKRI